MISILTLTNAFKFVNCNRKAFSVASIKTLHLQSWRVRLFNRYHAQRVCSSQSNPRKNQRIQQKENFTWVNSIQNGYRLFELTVRQYGKLALGVHITVFFSTFSCFYAALRNGLDGDTMLKVLHSYVPMLNDFEIHPEWGKLGLAYAMTAVCGPVRYLITIFGTPRLFRYLYGASTKK